MSAFSADGDFVPRLPAHTLRADATADLKFGQHLANSRLAAARGCCNAPATDEVTCLGLRLNTSPP
jgi:hypothetical protein